jgi:hypothetical protein
MAKSTARVTVIDTQRGSTVFQEPSGGKRWKKRKNRARKGWLWPVEHTVREYIRAEGTCWSEMLRLHKKSARKRGDWWVVADPSTNCVRAHEKAIRRFLRRI